MTSFSNKLALITGITGLLIGSHGIAGQPASPDANPATNNDVAYVDSVHNWGAWELDLEPAAGGVQPPGSQPLRARDTILQPRTNSFAALAPTRAGINTGGPAPTPITPSRPNPVTPVNPGPPTMTPVSPSVPAPVGGPSDGF